MKDARGAAVVWFWMLVALLAGAVAGCERAPSAGDLALAPADHLPAQVLRAPAPVQEAYRFAVANKALLQQIPCFCGCVDGGHRSNYECYVAADGGPGKVLQYDAHAVG